MEIERGLLHHQINQCGTTAECFNEFLAATSQAAGVDERVAFVMDNAPYHRRAAQADIGQHHVVRHLPANSPFLKPRRECHQRVEGTPKAAPGRSARSHDEPGSC